MIIALIICFTLLSMVFTVTYALYRDANPKAKKVRRNDIQAQLAQEQAALEIAKLHLQQDVVRLHADRVADARMGGRTLKELPPETQEFIRDPKAKTVQAEVVGPPPSSAKYGNCPQCGAGPSGQMSNGAGLLRCSHCGLRWELSSPY